MLYLFGTNCKEDNPIPASRLMYVDGEILLFSNSISIEGSSKSYDKDHGMNCPKILTTPMIRYCKGQSRHFDDIKNTRQFNEPTERGLVWSSKRDENRKEAENNGPLRNTRIKFLLLLQRTH